MLKVKPYLFFLLLFLSKIVEATHIVGGEIYYDNLGGNNYRIHMKVYRDCINGIPPFDDPAFFTVFDANSNVVRTFTATLLSDVRLPPTNNNACAPNISNTACVEEGTYEIVINLPPRIGGYYIAYQRCCRNGTILNLVNPGDVGTTYWEHIPGPEVVPFNNSPRFSLLPPIYICNNNPIAFNHVATDPDGDSLVYELCTPFNGLNTSCPVMGGGLACPPQNEPPPYVSVPFIAPYNPSYPMSSNPAININSSTGFLNGTPNILGQWVVGVCVSEYRNGVLIGTHHRDFQFNVIPCPFVVTADIITQTTTNNGAGTGYCNGFTISYSNNSSSNATSYLWDFGDPSTNADTSRAYNPTYTFPSIGDYTVTLIVNPGSQCSDTTKEVFYVRPLLSPNFITPLSQCLNGNNYNFVAGGSFQGNGTFSWSFGSNSNPSSASTRTVNNVSYNAPGVYPVSLTISENGCTATKTNTVQIFQSPVASMGNFSVNGCSPLSVTFPNQSTAGTPMNFIWNFSDGTTSTSRTPTHIFTQPGVYSATLTVSTNANCIATTSVSAVNSITVNATPSASFNIVSSGPCFDGNQFDFTSPGVFQGLNGTLTWNFGSDSLPIITNTRTVNNISYPLPGNYSVSLTASENGCTDVMIKSIDLYANPKASIESINAAGCDPQLVEFNNLSTAASNISYIWNFSDGTSSTEKNPIHVFTPPGIYNYTLTIFTSDRCIDTNQIVSINSITVSPSPTSSFSATPIITSIFEPEISFSNLSGEDVTSWQYDFDDGNSSTNPNPFHTYTTWGDYYVTQKVTNIYGCPNSTTILIKILPEFRFWIPNAFTPGESEGLNDFFKPIVIGATNYTFMIFNRWGDMIYKTNDTEAGWNGTFNGKESPMDVYVWKCEFRNVVTKQLESRVGHVTLVR